MTDAVVQHQGLAEILLVGVAHDVRRHRTVASLVQLADQRQQHLIAERRVIDQSFREQRRVVIPVEVAEEAVEVFIHRIGVGVGQAQIVKLAQRPRRDDEVIFREPDHHQPVEVALHDRAQRRQIDAAVRAKRPGVLVAAAHHILRQLLAPLVDERQILGVDVAGVTLVAQPVEAAVHDVVIGQLPDLLELVQIGAGPLERQHQPVAAGVEQAQLLEVGQDRPCAVVGKSIVDRLLFFLGAVYGHAGQRHLAGRDHALDRAPRFLQFLDDAKPFRFEEDRAARFGDQRDVGAAYLGRKLILVAGRVFDRPAQHIAQQPVNELADHARFVHQRAILSGQGVVVA